MPYYAHSSGTDKAVWQPLKGHLEAVAAISESFASKFHAQDFGYAVGLLHDLGKYSREFQQRLEGALLRVDHATAGAREARQLYGGAVGTLLAYVVAGHHSGLPDYGTEADESSLDFRLRRKTICDYQGYLSDSLAFPVPGPRQVPITPQPSRRGFAFHFLIRMLYSCLVDADFLDTESAFDGRASGHRGGYPHLSHLAEHLDRHMLSRFAKVPDTPVNRHRAAILRACREKALEPPGLFTLTVPTGGGKTLASLSFAMRHAVQHGLDRVIYVIPFTSIIEQNAKVFREALGEGSVLEHHSNFQYPDDDEEAWNPDVARLRLSSENWDAPVVVTTNVQFFESLFANRSTRCRKLHNLARSVIVLDEAQMMPTHLLKPCVAAIQELVVNYGSTVVLCTATQPALGNLLPEGIDPKEIVSGQPELFQALRRVDVALLGRVGDEQLAAEILRHDQVLCIVNTRAHARNLFELIRAEGGSFHLSARMCPVHRAKVLDEIRGALNAGRPCRVVSTQLIEAGVDVDFPVVFRAVAGLDSIAQAAGRCNREGRLERGRVFVFQPVDRPLKGWFQLTASIAETVLRDGFYPLDPPAIKSYFADLYDVKRGDLDREGIMQSLEEENRRLSFPFADIARKFRVIESDLIPIVVPFDVIDDTGGYPDDRITDIIRSLAFGPSQRCLRKLQPYVVQVYPDEFMGLLRSGRIRSEGGIINVLTDLSVYSNEVGLQPPDGTANDLLWA